MFVLQYQLKEPQGTFVFEQMSAWLCLYFTDIKYEDEFKLANQKLKKRYSRLVINPKPLAPAMMKETALILILATSDRAENVQRICS